MPVDPTVAARTPNTRIVSARSSVWEHIKAVWEFRELLVLLTRTELKVKYKNSALGFLWSMLNPALYLVVYYIVFQLILGSGIPNFAIFLLSGLLIWNLFSVALPGAAGSMVGSSAIVKKVSLPREILVLAPVGAGLIHFFLQTIVLLGALVLFQHNIGWEYVWLLPFALAVLLLFTSGLGIFLSAVNVYLRDTMHFLELLLLAWFWMTPIVYPFRLIADKGGWAATLYKANPILWIVLPFQRAIYNEPAPTTVTNGVTTTTNILPTGVGPWWYFERIAIVGVLSVIITLLAIKYFARVEGNIAEEL